MSTTISYDGGPALTPDIVNIASVTASSAPRTITHEILDGPPVHTLRSAGPLQGTLALTFRSAVDARDCFDVHTLAAVLTLASTDRALFNLRYIVRDTVDMALDQDTASHWVVTVPFEEVLG